MQVNRILQGPTPIQRILVFLDQAVAKALGIGGFKVLLPPQLSAVNVADYETLTLFSGKVG
jgi:hypothetical protein